MRFPKIRNFIAVAAFLTTGAAHASAYISKDEEINDRNALIDQLVKAGVCDMENAYLYVQDIKDEANVKSLLQLLKTHRFEQMAVREIWTK